MPANWSTPRTWISGETVTPVMMNRYVRNNLDFVGNPPLCRVTRQLTDQSHASSGSFVKVGFDTAALDGHGLADIANDKIVIAATGVYMVMSRVRFAPHATGFRALDIRVNAAGSAAGGTSVAVKLEETAGSFFATDVEASALVTLNADDELEMFAYQTSGETLALQGTSFPGAVAMSVLYQSTLGDDVYDDGDYDGPYITTESLEDGAVTPIKTSAGYVAKTTTYTATLDDKVIEATSGTWSLTLPTAVGNEGREYTVHNSGTGTITIDPAGAELINGAAALAVASKGSVSICSTGAAWIITSDVVDTDTAMGTLVQGPASATDNAVARFDGTTGKLLQNSGITVDDSGSATFTGDATISKAGATAWIMATSGSSTVVISGQPSAGSAAGLSIRSNGSQRWTLAKSGEAETGSNVGSNLELAAWSDTASLLSTPILIKRSTGKITLGAPGASAGVELGSSGPRIMSGTGSPESVVTAPVGSIWFQTDSTVGVTHWRKATGSGNTGWVVMEGDTGWRNVSADRAAAYSAGSIYIRRVNQTVYGKLVGLTGAATLSNPYVIPTGFKPDESTSTTARELSNGAYVAWQTYGDNLIYEPSSGWTGSGDTITRAAWSWLTSQAWPTSLPGS